MNIDLEQELNELYNRYDKILQERNELKKENKLLKKDLELLDILKKHYDKDSLILSLGNFISFHIYKDDKDFNKIKEVLENDNRCKYVPKNNYP